MIKILHLQKAIFTHNCHNYGVRFLLHRGKHMVMDDKELKGPQDAARVNIHEEHELEYWSRRFRVSKAAVIRAVSVVGVMAKDVSEFLNGRGTYTE